MIRRYPFIFSVLMLIAILQGFSTSSLASPSPRKKVAVVLSGGGAKGAAHIGALKVIEEAGIPVDIVVGTSMGAIVGGLYSIGYTSFQLDSMVRKQDWAFLLTDKVDQRSKSVARREFSDKFPFSIPLTRKKPQLSGFIRGENINTLFAELTVGYHGFLDFNQLPRRYACVATNMETGSEYVFHSGNLAVAMRASMAIPGIFTPVYVDSLVLADGGLCNNYPADVAKQMGADIIIGISVHQNLRNAENLVNMNNILLQVVDLACRNKLEDNALLTDLFVHVNAEPYTTASFNSEAIDSLISKGETSMRKHWQELLNIKKLIGNECDAPQIPPFNSLYDQRDVYLQKIHINLKDASKVKKLIKRCKLQENAMNSLSQIQNAIAILREEYSFSDVRYELKPQTIGYDLELLVNTAKDTHLNLGARYDSQEHASLLLGLAFKFNTDIPSAVGITARLGERFLGRIDYTLTPTLFKHFNFAYTFYDNDFNVHKKGDRMYNCVYRQHQFEFKYSNLWWRNLQYDVGLRFDAFSKPEVLYSSEFITFPAGNSSKFVNYFLHLKYSSLDKTYYPTHGLHFEADYTLYTDNFYQRRGHTPFSAFSATCQAVIPITPKFSILPFGNARFLIGRDVAPYYENYFGGVVNSRLFEQQVAFPGIYNLELGARALWMGGLEFRKRITGQHYLTLDACIGGLHNKVEDIFHDSIIYGTSIGYGWNSAIGPIQLKCGYSNHTESFKGYLNVGYYF